MAGASKRSLLDHVASRVARSITRSALAVLLVLALATAAWAQRVAAPEGHARTRFPLAVWAEPFDDVFEQVIRRVAEDWNALVRELLDVDAFTVVDARERADVRIGVGPRRAARTAQGIAWVDAGADQQIKLPVKITVYGPPPAAARTAMDREAVLYVIIAHELGHALGLTHVDDVRSLMCCVHMPSARINVQAYWDARRRPDVRSVRDQLAEHYAAFWAMDIP